MEIIAIIAGIITIIIFMIGLFTWLALIMSSYSFGELFIKTAFGWIIVGIPTAIAIAIVLGLFKLLEIIIQLF